jgi:NAD(P)H-dependent FMN reductase
MQRADGLVLVTPEDNHSFPGALKSLLDTCLQEHVHRAADTRILTHRPSSSTPGVGALCAKIGAFDGEVGETKLPCVFLSSCS